jgi:hypothetical protein
LKTAWGRQEKEMKFVRWLGAFRKTTDLSEAAVWELSQTARQIAAEPLHRGQSLVHAQIGLEIAHAASRFHCGWLEDAWTEVQADGTLRAKYLPRSRQGRKYRNMDRFLGAWNSVQNPRIHAEAVFDSPVYRAVVVKTTATERGLRRAKRLAATMNLPLKVLFVKP